MIRINNLEVFQNKFNDGTPLLKIPYLLNLPPEDPSEVLHIEWKYENMEELFNLYSIVRQIQSFNCHNIELDLPFLPNARQDRCTLYEDVFTLKWFAEIINSLNFKAVWVDDPHSDVCVGLINNAIKRHKIEDRIVKLISQNKIDLLYYPDNGAEKKYSQLVKFPYAFGVKHRDWSTQKLLKLEVVGNVQNQNILIIDDICATGGTLIKSAQELKRLGCENIYIYITHCEHTIFKGELLNCGLIEKIYTTNSIYKKEHDLIEVIK